MYSNDVIHLSQLQTKSSGDCVQMYYFWKKLCVDYKVSHLKMEPVVVITPAVEKPYVCEIADCSAVSFSYKMQQQHVPWTPSTKCS